MIRHAKPTGQLLWRSIDGLYIKIKQEDQLTGHGWNNSGHGGRNSIEIDPSRTEYLQFGNKAKYL